MSLTKKITGIVAVALVLTGVADLWAEERIKEPPFHPELPSPNRVDVVNFKNDYLKGLKGVQVLVEGLSEDGKAIGLTEDRLKTATELALRRNGVQLLTEKEYMDTRGLPCLYVNVTVLKNVHTLSVNLRESVRLERNPRVVLFGAIVWTTGQIGTHAGPDPIVKGVEETVEEFCNAYLKANPKK